VKAYHCAIEEFVLGGYFIIYLYIKYLCYKCTESLLNESSHSRSTESESPPRRPSTAGGRRRARGSPAGARRRLLFFVFSKNSIQQVSSICVVLIFSYSLARLEMLVFLLVLCPIIEILEKSFSVIMLQWCCDRVLPVVCWFPMLELVFIFQLV
jgi:hypothetical protein